LILSFDPNQFCDLIPHAQHNLTKHLNRIANSNSIVTFALMGDGFQIIAVGGIFISVFSIALLFRSGADKLFNRLIASWLFALGLNQVYFFISRSPWSEQIPDLLHVLGYSMPFFHFPLLYLFVRYSLFKKFPLQASLHFIPWLFFAGGILLFINLRPESYFFKDGFLVWKEEVPFIFYQHGRFIAVVAAVYTIWSYLVILSYKRKLTLTHANEAPKIFNWVQHWIILAIVFFVATYLVIEISLYTSWIKVPDTFGVISVFTTIYIAFVSYNGVSQTASLEHIDANYLEKSLTLSSSPDEDRTQLIEIAEQLNQLMHSEQLFLNPDLNISDLADALALPVGKISLALNKGAGVNFYDFVNAFRADHFKEIVHKKEFAHFNLLGVALECGFSSKSTFNDFFKRYTGMTPSQYKNTSG